MAIRFVCVDTDEGFRKLVGSDRFVIAHGLESLRDPRFGPLVEGELKGLPTGPRRVYLKTGNGTPPNETMLVRFPEDPKLHGRLDAYDADGYALFLPAEAGPDEMWQAIATLMSGLEI